MGGVLAKISKADQDTRFDLPTLGPRTVVTAARAGLSAIVCEARRTLILDRPEVEHLAEHHRISLVAI